MFTIDNYFKKISTIDISSLPEALRKGHDFVMRATADGADLDTYHASESVKKTVDLYFQKLSSHIEPEAAKATPRKSNYTTSVPKKKTKDKKNPEPKSLPQSSNKDASILVERIPEEIRFIRRFVNLHGKTKEKDDLLRFINSLQKAILEKRIRKTSQYAEQISYIQNGLIETYNSMKGKMTMQIKPDMYEALKKLAMGAKVLPAINFIKRYIGMNGKAGIKEKAKLLLSQIDKAYEKGKVKEGDAYSVELHQVKMNLQDYISEKGVRTLNIEKATLNGLQGILNGCNTCGGGLSGLGNEPPLPVVLPPVMNSMEFAKVKFSSIGLKGKWLRFIGDPSRGFSAMLSARPKYGKSTLAVDFAGELARGYGPTLYVAKEEGLNRTLQDKLNKVKHPNLTVASFLPEDLTKYEYVFLDSVTSLQLKPEDLRRLQADNPGKSFIYIFQVTKDGRFRGSNDFQHDVDVVIEIPEKGRAVQMGRFNQGGEMDIFKCRS